VAPELGHLRWISPQADQSAGSAAPGTYVYRTTFVVNDLTAAGLQIEGKMTADDHITDVR
jgi:hypothetical protein